LRRLDGRRKTSVFRLAPRRFLTPAPKNPHTMPGHFSATHPDAPLYNWEGAVRVLFSQRVSRWMTTFVPNLNDVPSEAGVMLRR